MKLKFFLNLLLFNLCLLTITSTFAQVPVAKRVRTFDVQQYIIRSNFDRKNKIYLGDSTIILKPLNAGFNTLLLDAAGMKFDSITIEPDNKLLKYNQIDEKLSITLDKSYSSNDTIRVRFKFTSKPQKGVYFRDEAKDFEGKILHPAQVWTQGEAEEAHFWFPSYDFPDDKVITEQFITTPKNEIAVANGELLETVENPDGTKTFHFKMPVEHSVYLTSFVVGNYVKVESKYKDIPLSFYVYPGKEAIAEKAYGKTPDMMRVYEELTGVNFPYNKYDQTIVAEFQFGGMENITATTMNDSEILMADSDYGKEITTDLVSHELAHSWFGDLVTCKSWSELWLNEGFATFMEAAYREKLNGRKDYLRKIIEDAESFKSSDAYSTKRPPLFNSKAEPVTLFDEPAFIYQKGGAVLHTLREEVGTENFWKAINAYLNEHKFGNVESTDLKKAMETASGKDLTWFFNQWVYKGGYPKLSVKQVYNPTTKKLTLTVSQVQKVDTITPAAFILPMDVEIVTAKGTKTEQIQINKRVQTFLIQLEGKPTKTIFDKDLKIPIKSVKMLPLL